jgi:hypothetical protein
LRPPRYIPALGPPKRSARQRVLAQWRGVDLTAAEKARTDRSSSTSALLPGVLKSIRIDQRQAEAEVLRVWNTAIDPTIVAHAQPTGIRKGTLFVTVDSSPWLSEIVRYRRQEILARLQHSFGKELIGKISFRVG